LIDHYYLHVGRHRLAEAGQDAAREYRMPVACHHDQRERETWRAATREVLRFGLQ
jgi:hypothetical protein